MRNNATRVFAQKDMLKLPNFRIGEEIILESVLIQHKRILEWDRGNSMRSFRIPDQSLTRSAATAYWAEVEEHWPLTLRLRWTLMWG